MSSSGVPNSDDLDQLLASSESSTTADTNITTYSDDLDAQRHLAEESKRVKLANGTVVQHRTWNTNEVFHSETSGFGSSPQNITMPFMASSPPPSPSPQKKRKFVDVDLGRSILNRPVKAQRVYYGIDIHQLLEEAQLEEELPMARTEMIVPEVEPVSKRSSLLWTEKYRARKFTDLIGDERTHRAVMHWLKRWDRIVFPGSQKPKPKTKNFGAAAEEKPFKKILMLTGPPGLGKTTLAHVCARQAGYEAQEINASDERSSNVVKGRIRDMLGTENVKGIDVNDAGTGKVRKAGKPVCVIVDEVDGVVSGSGGSGEGGFVKALIDLVTLDSKNSTALSTLQQAPTRKKKGDRFRMQRPLILICNDVYHPSLRPLRQSSHAEVIHVRKPPVQSLISRLQNIFDREGVPCDGDGVRRLCEATWGVSNRKEDRSGSGAGEGDMRGIMVVGEWVAGKLRAAREKTVDARLTRRWVEDNLLQDLSHGGGAARGLGRGGPKDIVERVFQEGAGFPKSTILATPQQQRGNNPSVKGVAEGLKRTAGERLRELVDTHGDTDRIMTDCFSTYPEHPFQDDTIFSKPDAAYEWLHFHDRLSSAVFSSNEWELAPYLSTPVLAFHHLFASPTRAQYTGLVSDEASSDETPSHPFIGTQASWAAHEASKHNESLLQTLQTSLSHDLNRTFNSTAAIATDLLPYLLRMLSPRINPVIIGGSAGGSTSTAAVRKASEQQLVSRAVRAMAATGVRFERTRVHMDDNTSSSGGFASNNNNSQWIYRMAPSIDELSEFATGGKEFSETSGTAGTGVGKTRYAVRQVLDEEWQKEEKRRAELSRQARFGSKHAIQEDSLDNNTNPTTQFFPAANLHDPAVLPTGQVVKRDFFGRPITVPAPQTLAEKVKGVTDHQSGTPPSSSEGRAWITFHEGFSNAVRKPIGLAELLRDL